MILQFNPRISGGFVEKILKDDYVNKEFDQLELTKEQKHNLTKAILIRAFTIYEVDINDVINKILDKSNSGE